MSALERAAVPGDAARLAGVRFLRSFDGLTATPEILSAIAEGRTSGVTLFRARNVSSPEQVRALCSSLQGARPAGDPALVIGFDQEGGQLQLIGDGATAWPGNLALGAAGSEDLARRCGSAIGAEVAALGGTLVYAPVCDVLHPESATPLGTRSFGDDPLAVARLAAAMTEGLQSAGIAATLKHFPGHGAAAADSHKALPVIDHDLAELRIAELPPFEAAIAAGALAVLTGHLAVPALTEGASIPATVSRAILQGLLREELGFGGVTVSDALDMAGATSGEGSGHGLGGIVGAAADAGMDLLLLNHDTATEEAAFESLRASVDEGKLERTRLLAAQDRILRLRAHLDSIVQLPLDVVGSLEHRRLAREIADASITLVRDPRGSLPLAIARGDRVAIIAPAPVDLTPAETSSYLRIGLAEHFQAAGLAVDELAMPLDPTPSQVEALAASAAGYAATVVCTFDAVSFPGQSSLVARLAQLVGDSAGTWGDAAARADSGGASDAGNRGDQTRRSVVAVALRSPYDAALYPPEIAAVATYGIQPPQIEALADALLGRIPFAGHLPVRLPVARPERRALEATEANP
jgi:beta-N-acetylhexosaminidase